MIKDALQYLFRQAELGVEAAKRWDFRVDQTPGKRHQSMRTVVDGDGQVETNIFEHEPPPRRVDIGSIDHIGDYIAYAKGNLGAAQPVVWIGDSDIVVTLDDSPGSHREETATCRLKFTEQFNRLQELADQSFTSKQLIRLLRVTFAVCGTDYSLALLKCARHITAVTQTGGNVTAHHGDESIERSVKSNMISQAGEIPENIFLRVQIFDDPALDAEHLIPVAVVTDPKEMSFELVPDASKVREFVRAEREKIVARMQQLDVPAFLGSP